MAADQLADRLADTGARVLPFRGGEGRAPSSVLLRQTVEAVGASDALIRGAMALAVALGETTSGERWGTDGEAGAIAELAARTGLTGVEVSASLKAMRDLRILGAGEEGLRLDPDLYCTLPALAQIDWSGARDALRRVGGRLAPALGLLRELARQSRRAADGHGEWLQPSVGELAEETLYGRTAVTQALGDLAAARLLARADQPARSGLRLRLTPRAFGGELAVRGREEEPPATGHGAVAEGGVTVEIGGASIGVPAGSRLELPQGRNYRLEIAPDGRATIRVDD